MVRNLKSSMYKTFAVLIVTLVTASYAQQDDLFWYSYTVDGAAPTGAFTSLQFDSNGFPHIAYTARADLELGRGVKYASFDGTRWTIEDVDPSGAGRLELALDDQNRPHIVYGSADQSTIMYATKNQNEWTLTPLLTAMSEGQAIYDRDIKTVGNTVHIIFSTDNDPRPNTEYSVVHVSVENGVVGEPYRIKNGIVGKWSSLAIGANEHPAVAFWDNGGDLFFAHYDGNQWNINNVDNDGYTNSQGFYPSLLFAGDEQKYYIAFQSHDPKKLRVASGTPGNWTIEEAGELPGWTLYTTPSPLVRDKNGRLFIAYYDVDATDLILLTKDGNSWSSSIIDGEGQVGQHASMALNADGLPAISYFNETDGYLQFAYSSTTEAEDRDNDLLPDYLELISGLSPFDADFDDDGLIDGEEDKNQNGIIDPGESDPKAFDTDNDGLSDGQEAGKTAGVQGSAGILGTDPNLFIPDSDPTTKTDFTKFDTDEDGLGDGIEDQNKDGRMDVTETDPLNRDTDGDGLSDGGEVNMYTSPFDRDSDNDGLMDGDEDANGNEETDDNETSPLFADSDNDGLDDGLELGVTVAIIDPDGTGRLKGTNIDDFAADIDPTSTTNPLSADTDSDGLEDSEEDVNQNGRIDSGETDPAKWDTDEDGAGDGDELRFGTDPLNPDDGVIIDVLFTETFDQQTLAGWTIIDDGDIEGPSNWTVHQNTLYQLSNIHNGSGPDDTNSDCMLGSYIWSGDKNWQDCVISFDMRADDDDGVGIMFRYLNEGSYYRISMSKELGKIWFARVHDGVCSILKEMPFDYDLGRWYDARLYAIEHTFSFQLDGETVFTANDDALKQGAFAFYTWKNAGAGFSDVEVVQLKSKTSVHSSQEINEMDKTVAGFTLLPSYPNPFSNYTTVRLYANQDGLASLKIYNVLGQLVYAESNRQIRPGTAAFRWHGLDIYQRPVPNGMYFIHMTVHDKKSIVSNSKSFRQKLLLAR